MKNITILIFVISLISCGQGNTDFYVKTTTIEAKNGNKTESHQITKFEKEYFETDLYCLKNAITGYSAISNLEDIIKDGVYYLKKREVTNKQGDILEWNTPEAFINYMVSCGYELVKHERQSEYKTHYLFKSR
ncbi:hypothetical protein [Carboxylicivirga marina]|uniref:hypothetical protein n=1 Tax=Carboxylicivirga marina TaxID=2800988 RepID=UPI002591CE04|nr:hypothetical protein [uncultured Carboxylicivirga sp.]